jgi:hypothetical protein
VVFDDSDEEGVDDGMAVDIEEEKDDMGDDDEWVDADDVGDASMGGGVATANRDVDGAHKTSPPCTGFSFRMVSGPSHTHVPELAVMTNVVTMGRLHLRLCWEPTEAKLKVPSPTTKPTAMLRTVPWGGKKKSEVGSMIYLGTTTTIGRKPSSDIILAHKCVSGKHVTITHSGFDGPTVTNHSSQHNVFIGATVVKSGQTIAIGNGSTVSVGGFSAENSLYNFLIKYKAPPINASRLCLVDGPVVKEFTKEPVLPTDNTVILFHDPSGQISREHATLRYNESSYTWTIADTGSDGNGTMNGVQYGPSTRDLRVIVPGEASAAQLNPGICFALGGAPRTNVGVRLTKIHKHVFCFQLNERPTASGMALAKRLSGT